MRVIDPDLLPTHGQLHRALAAALLGSALLTLTTVLPAEYGLDPTGVGGLLGLTSMGELKQQPPPDPVEYTFRTEEVRLTLKPDQGTEVKAEMRETDTLIYSWTTEGGPLYYDFHGEPEGAAADVFTSFETGTRTGADGSFSAPFAGTHGWYWKNLGESPVTLVLTTRGVHGGISER